MKIVLTLAQKFRCLYRMITDVEGVSTIKEIVKCIPMHQSGCDKFLISIH